MNEGDRFIEIVLKNGEHFSVKGETINDVPNDIHYRDGWVAFELTNDKSIQIWAGEIACIYEREFRIEPLPF